MTRALVTLDKVKTFEDWIKVGEDVSFATDGLQFWIGDWLNWGKTRYERGKYEEGLKLFPQYEWNTMRAFAQVAGGVESDIRISHLPWGHHQLVAVFEPVKQAELLQVAADRGLKQSEFRRLIRDRNRTDPPPMPAGKYRVIYADPPWSYSNSGFKQSAESHYPTMPTEEICALPVGELAGDGSVVFLWATSPLLPDAMRVLEAWGATYKAGMVWVKPSAPGLGWWVRTRHEHLLIASFGGNEQPATMPDSVIEFPRSAHSQKPGAVYDTIEEMYPGPYVELFARNERDGWSRWGDESMDGAA